MNTDEQPIPGTIYLTADDRTERMITRVIWSGCCGNHAVLPRVEYVECNNGKLSMNIDRWDVFRMATAASSVIRSATDEPEGH